MFSIKNFKNFKGHDGEPLAQGTLHGPTGKVAEWSDDAWGGPMAYRFKDAAAEKAFAEFAKAYLGDKKNYDGQPFDISAMTQDDLVTSAISQMSFILEEEKQLASHAKKGIAYYVADPKEPEGKSLYVWKAPYTAENVARLRKETPKLMEIINERLGMPLIDAKQAEIAEQNKQFKKLCQTKTLFTLREPDNSIKTMQRSQPYSALTAAQIRARHPNLVEIINERYL